MSVFFKDAAIFELSVVSSLYSLPAKEGSHWGAPPLTSGWANQDWGSDCCTDTRWAAPPRRRWAWQKHEQHVKARALQIIFPRANEHAASIRLTRRRLTSLWSGPAPPPRPFLSLRWWFHILTCRQSTHWENICKTTIYIQEVTYKVNINHTCHLNEVKMNNSYLLWFLVVTTALAMSCWRSRGSMFKSPRTLIQTPCFSRFSLKHPEKSFREQKKKKTD